VIDIALECRKKGEKKVILFNMSGHGYFDIAAYEAYINGSLLPYEHSEGEVERSISKIFKLYPWLRELSD